MAAKQEHGGVHWVAVVATGSEKRQPRADDSNVPSLLLTGISPRPQVEVGGATDCEAYPYCFAGFDPHSEMWHIPRPEEVGDPNTVREWECERLEMHSQLWLQWRGRGEHIFVSKSIGKDCMRVVPCPPVNNQCIFAVELLLDESTKQPSKLVRFGKTVGAIGTRWTTSLTLYAHTFCFATGMWVAESQITVDNMLGGAVHKYTCTYAGLLLILLRDVQRHKFKVVAYSMHAGKFGVVVPWADTDGCLNWENSLLTVNPELLSKCRDRSSMMVGTGSGSSYLDAVIGWVQPGIEILVGRVLPGLGPLIHALRYMPQYNCWKIPEEAFAALVRCRKPCRDMVCGWDQSSLSDENIRFNIAPAEAGAVYVAAYPARGRCTHVGHYTLSTHQYRRLKALRAPHHDHLHLPQSVDHEYGNIPLAFHGERVSKPWAFHGDFCMHSFV